MKKIKLIFIGLGYNNYNQACISIYNCNNELVYEGLTYNNQLDICLEECNVYKIVAISNNLKLVTSFYVNNNNRYIFSFNNVINNDDDSPITFILTDLNYENLPIERGELLWQN